MSSPASTRLKCDQVLLHRGPTHICMYLLGIRLSLSFVKTKAERKKGLFLAQEYSHAGEKGSHTGYSF